MGFLSPLFLSGLSAGIGIAEEASGIGLAAVAKPVDFVIESPHWMPAFELSKVKVDRAVERTDGSDLQEMMQIYAQWRSAA